MAESHIRASRDRRRDPRGVGSVDDIGAVCGIGHSERDPEVRIRADLAGDDTGRALRRKDQVDAKRSSALGDVHEAGHEIGQFACH